VSVFAGAVVRGLGSRAVLAGGRATGWTGRVTVPFRLKLESSLGPMLSVAAGDGGALAVPLSWASNGAPASSKAAIGPERQTKCL